MALSMSTELYIIPHNCPTSFLALPETAARINQRAFSECKNLLSVFIPDNSVKVIDAFAFENAINLKTIDFPASIETVCENAFKGCKHLQCGLLIDQNSLQFKNQLKSVQLPKRCFISCKQAYTCKVKGRKVSASQAAVSVFI